MARVSPFLSMLLAKKRPTDGIPYEDPNDPIPEPVDAGPTIPIRRIPQVETPIVPAQPVEQQPTIPVKAVLPVNEGASPPPPIPMKPRSAVEDAADVVRKYDQGLHPDPKTGEWVPHHRNKGLQILEGLGNVAASGVGINLQNILHPRGTPDQQARRRLADETAIEDQSIQRTRVASDIAGDTATAAWRTAEAERLQREAKDPKQTPAAKAKAEAIKISLGLHKQPFDPNDPADVALLAAAKEQGIIINPDTYGEKDESGKNVQFADEVLPDGRKRKIQFDPKTKSWDPSKGATGDVITDVPKPEKPPDEVPDTAGPIGELEGQFRANAAKAQKAAEEAEAKVRQYTAEQARTVENYDPSKDANVASLTAEARRQRAFAEDQLKHADGLAVKKVEAGNKTNTERGKGRTQGSPAPTTHSFSVGAYIKRNKGATEADARAFAAKNYPGFEIAP